MRTPDQLLASDHVTLRDPGLLSHVDEIERAGPQASDQGGGLSDRDLDVDERVLPAEVAEDSGQVGEGEVVSGAKAHGGAFRRAGEVRVRLIEHGEDAAREREHRLAAVGEADAVGVPGEECAAGLLLEAADPLADGGLADPELSPGLGEAAVLGHGDEAAQQIGLVHARSSRRGILLIHRSDNSYVHHYRE